MGRNHNQIVTYNDLKWMEDNNMLYADIPMSGGSLLCATRGALRLSYRNIDESLLTGYPNNRLVPYQKIQQMPILHAEWINKVDWNGETVSSQMFNYWGYSWTLTWKKYVYWEVPPYEGQYIEDTSGTWFSATPTSGSNAPTINMTFDYSDSPASRYVVLTITSNGQSYDTYLYQNANPGVPTKQVTLAWAGGNDIQQSCEYYAVDQNIFYYYIGEQYTWTGATKLYENIEGTKLAPSGFYSNGQHAKYWNRSTEEFTIVGPNNVRSVQCNTVTPPEPDPVYDNNMITLAKYQTTNSAENACSMFANNVTQTYYIPNGTTFSNTTVIYTDIDGNNTAVTGWYSDGVTARLWIKETGLFQSSAACS